MQQLNTKRSIEFSIGEQKQLITRAGITVAVHGAMVIEHIRTGKES